MPTLLTENVEGLFEVGGDGVGKLYVHTVEGHVAKCVRGAAEVVGPHDVPLRGQRRAVHLVGEAHVEGLAELQIVLVGGPLEDGGPRALLGALGVFGLENADRDGCGAVRCRGRDCGELAVH
eukprot:3439033-Rhodomonas_salina.1